MNGARNGTFFAPPPGALGRGQISLNIIKFQLHSKFQRLLTKLCHEKYKAYQTGFSFGRLGHAPVGVWGGGGGGGGGGWGGVIFCFPKSNQIWCVSYLHEWHMHRRHFYAPPPPLVPWGGAKRSNIIKSELQSQFQRFLNQTHK